MRVFLSVCLLAALWLLFAGCVATKRDAVAKKDDIAVLIEAAGNGEQAKVSALLKTSEIMARLKQLDGKLAITPLHTAAAKGHVEIVRLLLDSGLPVDAKDGKGQSPLHYAVIGRHPAVVSFLLERKANFDAKSNSYSFEGGRVSAGLAEMMPLSLAANGGDVEIIKLLLDHGADIDGGTNTATPLYYAAAGGYEDAVKLLLKRGAQVKTSVTFRAITEQQPQTAKLLRDHYCRREAPQLIGIANVDKTILELRKMDGCGR